ncbi:MAG: amino acid racemase [Betaproteobacteria bacterium]|nr:amino acid racemase [Betaproteobacteria bacterium]
MKDGTSPLLGVLGGMGPLATVDFLEKLIAETPAERDADHVPVVVYSVPQIPDRPAAILAGAQSPLPAMLAGIRTLTRAGASRIAIPCNTAHYWYDDLAREAGVPIVHIADATCEALAGRGLAASAVGLIATKGTIAAGFFQQRLAARGLRVLLNSEADQNECVLPAIAAVKRNNLGAAFDLAVRACERLRAEGAQAIILACTEIPPALEHRASQVAAICVDPTRALARACAAWWLGITRRRPEH